MLKLKFLVEPVISLLTTSVFTVHYDIHFLLEYVWVQCMHVYQSEVIYMYVSVANIDYYVFVLKKYENNVRSM